MNSTSTVNTQSVNTTKQAGPDNGLGKDAFLKILVTQMKNQNPLEPLKDTEFIGQMAQFSSLEQLTNLNTTMNQFIGLQGNETLAKHANLIGKTVHWEQEINGQLQSGEGVVKALSFFNGELLAELDKDDIKVPIETIHRIEN
ncbi:flagellar hook capping FlgD N-terminal domain-containing protein [Paenisporosarcina indica]|uniref:flagellar hook capping FlgD N-terminal domain-containing protein n=1 Tax=Paenisporosarcina indica TaxID=650093 RepID=UPI001FE9B228|nr:flagellar hook capping FlgD N-terminal domain-containing protein [Paenisporosarcina indica]